MWLVKTTLNKSIEVMFLDFQEETCGTLNLKNKRVMNGRELKDTGCGLGVVWG